MFHNELLIGPVLLNFGLGWMRKKSVLPKEYMLQTSTFGRLYNGLSYIIHKFRTDTNMLFFFQVFKTYLKSCLTHAITSLLCRGNRRRRMMFMAHLQLRAHLRRSGTDGVAVNNRGRWTCACDAYLWMVALVAALGWYLWTMWYLWTTCDDICHGYGLYVMAVWYMWLLCDMWYICDGCVIYVCVDAINKKMQKKQISQLCRVQSPRHSAKLGSLSSAMVIALGKGREALPNATSKVLGKASLSLPSAAH